MKISNEFVLCFVRLLEKGFQFQSIEILGKTRPKCQIYKYDIVYTRTPTGYRYECDNYSWANIDENDLNFDHRFL